MAQFEVYQVDKTLVVDAQSDMTIGHGARVVIPLMPFDVGKGVIPGLEPVFMVSGEKHVLHTGELLAIPERLLSKPIADLRGEQDRIKAAVDFLFYGF